MENRLIQCAIDGKEEAIVIFENMIRENIRDKEDVYKRQEHNRSVLYIQRLAQ